MKNRIKEIRKELNLTQQEFADRIGVKRNTIATYESGRNTPIDAVISLICREFSVNKEWLRNGTGPMFVVTPSSTMEQLKKEFNLDEFSYNLVYEYLKLDQKQRDTVRKFFYNIIKEEPKIQQSDNNIEESCTVEEAEAAYIKSRSKAVKRTELSASNITADKVNSKNTIDKAVNQ